MRSIYVVRHSAREPHEPHLSLPGVRMARAQGELLGPMARVCSSPALRCIETVVALGCAVQEECDALALPDDDALAMEFDLIGSFADAVRQIEHGTYMPAYARSLRTFVESIAEELYDHEDALLVTHGGVVEVLTALLAGADATAKLGMGVGFCDGVRLIIDNDGVSDHWTVQRLCT